MAASSGTRSVRLLLLLLLCLLGFCVALSHQESAADSCARAKVAVASLVPFDSTSFRCTAAWKQQDFVLRVCLLLEHFCDPSHLLPFFSYVLD